MPHPKSLCFSSSRFRMITPIQLPLTLRTSFSFFLFTPCRFCIVILHKLYIYCREHICPLSHITADACFLERDPCSLNEPLRQDVVNHTPSSRARGWEDLLPCGENGIIKTPMLKILLFRAAEIQSRSNRRRTRRHLCSRELVRARQGSDSLG